MTSPVVAAAAARHATAAAGPSAWEQQYLQESRLCRSTLEELLRQLQRVHEQQREAAALQARQHDEQLAVLRLQAQRQEEQLAAMLAHTQHLQTLVNTMQPPKQSAAVEVEVVPPPPPPTKTTKTKATKATKASAAASVDVVPPPSKRRRGN